MSSVTPQRGSDVELAAQGVVARCPFAETFAAYEIEHRDHNAEQTLREKRVLLGDMLEFCGSALEGVTRERVSAFLEHLSRNGRPHRLPDGSTTRRKTRAGPKSRKTYLSHIRAFFAWCVQTERIRSNPCDGIRPPRVLRKQGRAFGLEEVSRILSAEPRGEFSAYYLTLLISGVRAGSLRRMPTFAFMLEHDQPRIEIPAAFSKTRRAYTAALDPSTASRLRILLESRGPDHRPSEPLFNVPGPSRMLTHLRRTCKLARVALEDDKGRRVGLHCFRRANVSRILELGFDAKVAQLQAGHSEVSTTLTNYTDRDITDQTRAVQALSDALASIPPDTGHARKENIRRNPDQPIANRGACPKIEQRRSSMLNSTTTSPAALPLSRRGTSLSRGDEGLAPVDVNRADSRRDPASMSKVGDTGFEPVSPSDLPPRLAGVVHHALRVAERWHDRFGRGSQESQHDKRTDKQDG